MANLQIKGIDDSLYQQIKDMASLENRSVSQQILYLAKSYITQKKQLQFAKMPAEVLLELSGSWADSRKPGEIISQIKKARRSSKKLKDGF